MANAEALANNYHTTLTAALNASATTVTVVSDTGAPATPFRAVIGPVTGEPTESVTATALSTLTPTLTRARHPIAAFDTTAPAISGPWSTGAVGTAAFAARRDHVHGRDAESLAASGAPTGVSPGFETITRDLAGASGVTTNVPASGTLQMSAIWLPSGFVLNNIAVRSGTTGANGPTHWWFSLYGNSLGLLAATADQTSTAWAASTSKVLAIATIASGASASFTTIYSGLYYVGFLMTSTVSNVSLVTVPSLINGIGPVLGAPSH